MYRGTYMQGMTKIINLFNPVKIRIDFICGIHSFISIFLALYNCHG
jgi:hypothetical protein